jgi:hypothetical protein
MNAEIRGAEQVAIAAIVAHGAGRDTTTSCQRR